MNVTEWKMSDIGQLLMNNPHFINSLQDFLVIFIHGSSILQCNPVQKLNYSEVLYMF